MKRDLSSGSSHNSLEEIVEDSIRFCQKITSNNPKKIIQLLKKDDARVNAALRYNLAKRIAEYFLRNGIKVINAYVFGSTIHEGEEVQGKIGVGYFSDIDIILYVDKKKEGYINKIKEIDTKLVKEITRKTGRPFPEDFKMLDVKLVTEKDIEKKDVFACLINSVHEPVCKIYP